MRALVSTILVSTLLITACGGGSAPPGTTKQSARPTQGAAAIVNPNILTLSDYRSRYDIQKDSTGFNIKKSDTDVQTNADLSLKRIHFADISLALDIENSGKIYRLYQAAFNRKPDINGMGFWLGFADSGHPLNEIARYFIQSAEFQQLVGIAPNDQDFITKLYNNVLHRAPDAGGLQFWLNALKSGTSREQALVYFSESDENVSQIAPLISTGILYVQAGISYKPIANAGENQTSTTGNTIYLDGSGSSDANGDKLSFIWTLSKPSASYAQLSTIEGSKSSFKADVAGTYTATLIVYDGTQYSESDSVTIQIAVPASQNITDTGIYKCSNISHALALQLFLQGHTYLDRDHDGKPCEATDISAETTLSPTIPPIVPTTPSTGQCWVNGYYRKNGTYVNGYWRRC